ncbi:DUF3231 family protein [Paenibacillus andongensis]|uniref:DUF3231 family protein n=1 Tax=Paenibacillus andongensis TaxID=2975482 RepID=UPI0021BAA20C|nr:DUF3231 family protein [Paenibacillus andongensis]
MEAIKPIKLISTRTNKTKMDEKLTSAEVGKLWATYIGNSMAKCVLSYFLQNIEDQEIKKTVEYALFLSEQMVQTIKEILNKENHPVPVGFTEDDVNLGAPRLFSDEFYLHYLKYAAKAGMSIYAIAVPLMSRHDVRTFFTNCLEVTIKLINQVNDVLIIKGSFVKAPYIPIPKKIEIVKKQSYLNGFLGHVRPLHALEITHLYDNIQNNVTSKSLLIGFRQVTKLDEVREFLHRGEKITSNHIETWSQLLEDEGLQSHPALDHLVTNSSFSPFSDKLMVFHKVDMFSMKIRSYGNSLAVDGRHDIAAKYAGFLLDVGRFAEDGAKLMINHEWMEQPPHASGRDA